MFTRQKILNITMFITVLLLASNVGAEKVIRRSFIYENKTDGELNPCARSINYFLTKSQKNLLKKTICRESWLTYRYFPAWAIWGYVCSDSQFKGDKKLLVMLHQWLVNFKKRVINGPTLQLKKGAISMQKLPFSPSELGMVLTELKLRPVIRNKVGDKLVDDVERFVTVFYQNAYNDSDLKKNSDNVLKYPNMATHDMANIMYGYLLTGDKSYLAMAKYIIIGLDKIQKPNGMFPYRFKIYGENHCEFENMYYRAKDVQAVFIYWWMTGDSIAEKILKRSIPFSPLNMEPPYFNNSGPSVWWKVSVRTFWPGQIAMIAAAAKDGENASIAKSMAKDGISHDRFDLIFGSLAYNLMETQKIKSKPLRNKYIVKDPDIRGMRLRYDNWSSTFSGLSFTATRYSAILTGEQEKRKYFDELLMARPYLRVKNIASKEHYESDYCSIGPDGVKPEIVLEDKYAVAACTYKLMKNTSTWSKQKVYAPCKNTEIWLMTESGAVGLMTAQFEDDFEALEYMHQFRFFLHKGAKMESAGKNIWQVGDFLLKVWIADLPYTITEKSRINPFNKNDYKGFQLALSSTDRSPENVIEKNDNSKKILKYCKKTIFSKGQKFFSLISLAPPGKNITHVKLVPNGFCAKIAGETYTITFKDKLEVKKTTD